MRGKLNSKSDVLRKWRKGQETDVMEGGADSLKSPSFIPAEILR